MSEPYTRLALLTPYGVGAAQVDLLADALAAACAVGDVAAVLLRLAPADERGLINLVKRVATAVQERGAALVIACPGFAGDLASIAARGGADGVHVDRAGPAMLGELRARLCDGRILGAGGVLESRHAAMEVGEAGLDYLMFGGLYPDGVAPDPDRVRERAQWWAEIFETPCIAVATEPEHIAGLAATGAEFIGLESALWLDAPEGINKAQALLRAAGEAW